MAGHSDDEDLETALLRLKYAVEYGRTRETCLALWSRFVRLRDGNRCVSCHSTHRLSAHHICRKSYLVVGQFDTGNGITLCGECHKMPHEGFNGRPDLSLPMDAQGGEKIDVMWSLYIELLEDAKSRCTLREDLYFLSDAILNEFKRLQCYDASVEFPGCSRLEKACLIWRQSPNAALPALMRANGVEPPPNIIQRGPITLFFDTDS